jgi:antitoxin (DNA-binding transcriptional repressor) of toxin-antitoxin stability system
MDAIERQLLHEPLVEMRNRKPPERNKPVAAVVPLRHVDRESLALSAHPEFLALIKRARQEFAAGKTLSFEEMKRRLERPRKARRSTATR